MCWSHQSKIPFCPWSQMSQSSRFLLYPVFSAPSGKPGWRTVYGGRGGGVNSSLYGASIALLMHLLQSISVTCSSSTEVFIMSQDNCHFHLQLLPVLYLLHQSHTAEHYIELYYWFFTLFILFLLHCLYCKDNNFCLWNPYSHEEASILLKLIYTIALKQRTSCKLNLVKVLQIHSLGIICILRHKCGLRFRVMV